MSISNRIYVHMKSVTSLARSLRRSAITLLPLLALAASPALADGGSAPWPDIHLPAARDVALTGPVGASLDRGLARLSLPPYTAAWLRSDISFEVNRIFTNYSGDVSGRFIELASLTSPAGHHQPPTLDDVLSALPGLQKADGHFGADVDVSLPLKRGAEPIPMLWGNARLLVGLVTAAQQLAISPEASPSAANPATPRAPRLVTAGQLMKLARKLGDFYVNTADQLCSPAHEAEFQATGSYGDGYAICYFPAIEGLAILYRATGDDRYLAQADRMAESFLAKFDSLPVDHSHGNLCTWRGLLLLYEIARSKMDQKQQVPTGGNVSPAPALRYLDLARAKWDKAMKGGYVWPIGGVGEHWYVSFGGDEGCSESDWLRFNLELWRLTGETKYLDIAERLLDNEYAMNQCANGGFGLRHFDTEAAGPVATRGAVDEWNFCCSFHGPLGLYFLKSYLAATSDRGIFVNFPLDFSAPVRTGGRKGQLTVHTSQPEGSGQLRVEIELAPKDGPWHTTVWVRVPDWAAGAGDVTAGSSDTRRGAIRSKPVGSGAALASPVEGGYLALTGDFRPGKRVVLTFTRRLKVEERCFVPAHPEVDKVSLLKDVTLLDGPHVLFSGNSSGSGRPTLLATIDKTGQLSLPIPDGIGGTTVELPTAEADASAISGAVDSARPLLLQRWSETTPKRREAFAFDLLVVPAASLSNAVIEKLAVRAHDSAAGGSGPQFGKDLEKQHDLWPQNPGWSFNPDGLFVGGGDIGLIDAQGYRDYRLTFDLVIPAAGEGIAGWIVRAKDEDNCVMFQLQTADSPFNAPEFKTKPNTLRPHIRQDGQWTIRDPVPLPKEFRRGETHHVAVECRGAQVAVSIDGEKVYTLSVPMLMTGSIGFRASGSPEQGVFSHITLEEIHAQ